MPAGFARVAGPVGGAGLDAALQRGWIQGQRLVSRGAAVDRADGERRESRLDEGHAADRDSIAARQAGVVLVVPDWRRPTEVVCAAAGTGERVFGILGGALQTLVIGGGFCWRVEASGKGAAIGAARRVSRSCLRSGRRASSCCGSPAIPRRGSTSSHRISGNSSVVSALVWVFYVAVEPYVRRLWPGTLVAWSRALEGRLRDPMVGRHILFGAIGGLGIWLLQAAPTLVSAATGLPEPAPGFFYNTDVLRSTGAYLGAVFGTLQASYWIPLWCSSLCWCSA